MTERLSVGPQWCDTAAIRMTGSGIMEVVPVFCFAGDVITTISWMTGDTAAETPTHWWSAIYGPRDEDGDAVLLSQTADRTCTVISALTLISLSLPFPVELNEDGAYGAALMIRAASVMPTLSGWTNPVHGDGRMSAAGADLSSTAPGIIHLQRAIPLVRLGIAGREP